jgi:hypothetical protein
MNTKGKHAYYCIHCDSKVIWDLNNQVWLHFPYQSLVSEAKAGHIAAVDRKES